MVGAASWSVAQRWGPRHLGSLDLNPTSHIEDHNSGVVRIKPAQAQRSVRSGLATCVPQPGVPRRVACGAKRWRWRLLDIIGIIGIAQLGMICALSNINFAARTFCPTPFAPASTVSYCSVTSSNVSAGDVRVLHCQPYGEYLQPVHLADSQVRIQSLRAVSLVATH